MKIVFLKYFYSSAAIMSKCLIFQYGYSAPVCVVLLHRKFQLWDRMCIIKTGKGFVRNVSCELNAQSRYWEPPWLGVKNYKYLIVNIHQDTWSDINPLYSVMWVFSAPTQLDNVKSRTLTPEDFPASQQCECLVHSTAVMAT